METQNVIDQTKEEIKTADSNTNLPGPGDTIYRFYEIIQTEKGEDTQLKMAIVIPGPAQSPGIGETRLKEIMKIKP